MTDGRGIVLSHWTDLKPILHSRGLLDRAADVGACDGNWSETLLSWGCQKVYVVDLWMHVPDGPDSLGLPQEIHDARLQRCLERLARYGDRAEILRGWSHLMAERIAAESLGFIYIDADHSYDSVLRDLEAWYPKLRYGAMMAGHDYLNNEYGVRAAVDEFAGARSISIGVIPENHPSEASFWFFRPEG